MFKKYAAVLLMFCLCMSVFSASCNRADNSGEEANDNSAEENSNSANDSQNIDGYEKAKES